jgi:hypothetical protein
MQHSNNSNVIKTMRGYKNNQLKIKTVKKVGKKGNKETRGSPNP